MYCEKCHVVTEYEICPDCGNNRLREVRPDDECLLTIIDVMFGEMLADTLREHQIPFFRRSTLGAALATYIGSYFERQLFYVPYSHLNDASDLLNAFFLTNGDVEISDFPDELDIDSDGCDTEEE